MRWNGVRFIDPNDQSALRWLGQSPGIQVVDLVPTQLDELVELLSVGNDQTPSSLRAQLLNGQDPHKWGIWVHYPWSRRLVRIAPKPWFRRLRTARNQHKLLIEEQQALDATKVAVIGLSVGNAVALTLAQFGVGHLVLADLDHIATTNLNRVRVPLWMVNQRKTRAAAQAIVELDPFVVLDVYDEGLTDDNVTDVLQGVDIVVEECDDLAAKVLVRLEAQRLGIPVVMETSGGMLDIERYDQEPGLAPFYGLLGTTPDPHVIRHLPPAERVPLVARIVGPHIHHRAAASMVEIQRTVPTWPQTAPEVNHGGAVVAEAVRRIVLGEPAPSGRRHVSLGEIVERLEPQKVETGPSPSRRSSPEPPLSGLHHAMLQGAVSAPSGGNAQPWAFVVHADGSIAVHHVRERSESWLDPDGRAGLLAVGGALAGLVLGAGQQGQVAQVHYTGNRYGCVARVVPTPSAQSELDPLAAWLSKRFTDRRRPERVMLSNEVQTGLRWPSGSEATVQWLYEPNTIDRLGEHLAALDRLRMVHPQGAEELWSEVRWTSEAAEATGDGLSLPEMDVSPAAAPVLQLVARPDVARFLRQHGLGQGLGETMTTWVQSASALGLLVAPSDSPAHLLDAGRHMHRMWLHCTSQGLGLQPITAGVYMLRHLERPHDYTPEEQAVLTCAKDALQEAFGAFPRLPLMLVRLVTGGDRYARSFRRPLSEVVTFAD